MNENEPTLSRTETPDADKMDDSRSLGSTTPIEVVQSDGPPPERFGEYEILGEIARGGMGAVFKARQVKLNRTVALKMILSGNLATQQEVARFQFDAEAAARLDHPGIVPVHEVGEHDGRHFFSMGFVDGESLADLIKDGPTTPRKAAEYTRKVAEAVYYAHQQGVVHRDLKPANVLLDSADNPHVTDFVMLRELIQGNFAQ